MLVYYRWLQLAYRSKRRQRILKQKKKVRRFIRTSIKKPTKIKKRKTFKLFNYRYRRQRRKIKKYSSWIRRRQRLDFWARRRRKRIIRLEKFQQKIRLYKIPQSIIWNISRIFYVNNKNLDLCFINIYSIANNHNGVSLLDRNMLRSLTPMYLINRVKYVPDLGNIYDLMSLKLCSAKVLNILISQALARNSTRRSQLQFIKHLKKLPTFFRRLTTQSIGSSRSWSWVIKITGKIGGSSRTRSLYIRPKQLALHTISTPLEYSQGVSDTKYGTFSVKIWLLE